MRFLSSLLISLSITSIYTIFPDLPNAPSISLCDGSIKTLGYVSYSNNKYTYIEKQIIKSSNSSNIDLSYIASGSYIDCIDKSGWDFLDISSSPDYKPINQAYALGYLEGAMSASKISQLYTNALLYFFPDGIMPSNVATFFEQQREWGIATANTLCVEGEDLQKFWCNVKYLLIHVDSLIDGYNSNKPEGAPTFTWAEFQVINADGDISDVINAVNMNSTTSLKSLPTHLPDIIFNRCSSIITLLYKDDNHYDLACSHTTWFSYQTMNRVYKSTTTYYGEKLTVSQSSYPGSTSSTDDWYISSNGLIVTETSNSVYDFSLYKMLIPQSLPCWLRCVLATRLATTAPEWSYYFEINHAGSYPNQWLVVDTKLYEASKPLKSNLFWVIEELPGYYIGQDQTSYLEKYKYFPSFNVPFYQEIYDAAGYIKAAAADSENSYVNASRAIIFKRDGPSVVNESMPLHKFMRYNEYQTDPASDGNPGHSIASRYDLLPGSNAIAYGAIDAKFSSANSIREDPFASWIISSPTYDNQIPFQWSDKQFNLTHLGQPTLWNFPFMYVNKDLN